MQKPARLQERNLLTNIALTDTRASAKKMKEGRNATVRKRAQAKILELLELNTLADARVSASFSKL